MGPLPASVLLGVRPVSKLSTAAGCLLMQGDELCPHLGFHHVIAERDGNKLGGSAEGTPLKL